jgi:hypothetical protein
VARREPLDFGLRKLLALNATEVSKSSNEAGKVKFEAIDH